MFISNVCSGHACFHHPPPTLFIKSSQYRCHTVPPWVYRYNHYFIWCILERFVQSLYVHGFYKFSIKVQFWVSYILTFRLSRDKSSTSGFGFSPLAFLHCCRCCSVSRSSDRLVCNTIRWLIRMITSVAGVISYNCLLLIICSCKYNQVKLVRKLCVSVQLGFDLSSTE